MKKLSWLKVGQHQFQKNVTHRLTLVLVDGRDNECVFSCLIGVFLLAVTSSIASSTKLLAQSIPCFVSDCRGHVSTPKSRGYRKSNRELPFPAFGASFLRFFRLFLNFIHYTTKSLFWTFPYEKVAIPNWNSYFPVNVWQLKSVMESVLSSSILTNQYVSSVPSTFRHF